MFGIVFKPFSKLRSIFLPTKHSTSCSIVFRYISRRVYPSPWYPTFCHGGMWTVTMSMVEKLWCAAQITDRGGFYLEDVYITGTSSFASQNQASEMRL